MGEGITVDFKHLKHESYKRVLRLAATVFAVTGSAGCAQLITHELRPYAYTSPYESKVEHPLNVTYFGTTTLLFDDGTTKVMVDGFVSRPTVAQLLFTWLKPDEEYIRKLIASNTIPKAVDLLLVTHAHHDHVLDSALISCLTGAQIRGPTSTLVIAKAQATTRSGAAHCTPDTKEVQSEKSFPAGQFTITPFNVYHSPLQLFSGEVDTTPELPAGLTTYRSGSTMSYLLQQGGTKILVSSGLPMKPVSSMVQSTDIVFLSIGGLLKKDSGVIEETWDEVVCKTGAKVVVPTHWDNFTAPLGEPLRVMPWPFANFDAVMDVIKTLAARDDVALHFLPPLTRFEVRELVGSAQLPKKRPRRCGQGVANPPTSR